MYLVIMLADWLQGTHMYTLYNSAYGLNPGTLLAIGFTSSAIFGTFLGLYVDQYGRRSVSIPHHALVNARRLSQAV